MIRLVEFILIFSICAGAAWLGTVLYIMHSVVTQ